LRRVLFFAGLVAGAAWSSAGLADSCPAGFPAKVLLNHVHVSIYHAAPSGRGRIQEPGSRPLRTGSGILLGESGMVVTAAHVARSTRATAYITTHSGTRHAAAITRVDPQSETAVLHIREPGRLEARAFSVNQRAEPGDRVVGIGLRPGQRHVCRSGEILSRGVGKTYRFGAFSFRDPIVVSMRAESGFSGGPVFDVAGRLIGMIVGYGIEQNEAGERTATGEAYVLPARRILPAVGDHMGQ